MEIGPVSGNEPRQKLERPVRPTEQTKPAEEPQDSVEISADARALLGETADRELKVQGREFGPLADSANDRNGYLDAIRRRIREGYYNRPDVRESIADKLMDDLKGKDRAEEE